MVLPVRGFVEEKKFFSNTRSCVSSRRRMCFWQCKCIWSVCLLFSSRTLALLSYVNVMMDLNFFYWRVQYNTWQNKLSLSQVINWIQGRFSTRSQLRLFWCSWKLLRSTALWLLLFTGLERKILSLCLGEHAVSEAMQIETINKNLTITGFLFRAGSDSGKAFL